MRMIKDVARIGILQLQPPVKPVHVRYAMKDLSSTAYWFKT